MRLSFRNSLAFRFLLTTVVLIVVAMGAGTLISVAITNKAMDDNARLLLQRQVDVSVGFANMWLDNQRLRVNSMAHEKLYQHALEKSFRGVSARQAVAKRFSKIALVSPEFNNLNLLDLDGQVLASDLPEEFTKELLINKTYLKRAIGGELVMSPVGVSGLDDAKVFAIYVPIQGMESTVEGLLYFEYSLQRFSDLFVSKLKAGTTGYGFLLDHLNHIIVHPQSTHIGRTFFRQEHALGDRKYDADGFLEYTFQGHHKVAYSKTIPELRCRLVLSVSSSELLAPSRKLGSINLLITLLVSIISLVSLLYLWRREISQPIGELVRGITEFKNGKLLYPVQTDPRNEFGSVAKNFNEMVENIQESTVSMKELRKQQENLLTILDKMAIGVLVVDGADEIQLINKTLLEILGDEQFLENHENSELPSMLCEFENNLIWESEFTNKKGEVYYIFRLVQKIRLGNKEVLLVTFVDVTERKNQERERQMFEQDVQAEGRLRAVGTLGAGIAHEINTPLQSIFNNIRFFEESTADLIATIVTHNTLFKKFRENEIYDEILVDQEADGFDLEFLQEEIPAALNQSLSGLEHITRIVQALKVFSRYNADEMSWYNLNEGVENTLAVSYGEWRSSITMSTHLDDNLPEVHCNVGDINQVLLGLIVNSVDSIVEKIGDKSKQEGEIVITTAQGGDYVVVRIKDNGMGMDEETESRAFEPFFTTREVGKGTGQGLTLARRIIVEKHRGEIRLETELGIGTTVVINLPITGKN